MAKSNVLNLLHPALKHIIIEKGWKKGLSEIQQKAFPILYNGEDAIIEAPTAGGKTEAVLFPIFTRTSRQKVNSVQVLYLAPLKALLNDIELRAKEYSRACGLHSFKWHGDVSQKRKIDEFKNPPQVLLTTPESLEAILLRKAGWNRFFSGLETIIIDEAHNFAGGDRGCHLVSLLERLDSGLDKSPQRIAVSATVGNPQSMLKWLAGSRRKLGKRIWVSNSEAKKKDFEILYFPENLDKYSKNEAYTNATILRNESLYKLLPMKKSIIFAGSRSNTEDIASAINKINTAKEIPVKIRTHHSSVSKYYREEAEQRIKIKNDFESGIEGIISTSTLELGIDIGHLDQVIQLDTLVSSSSFLQRVGRTGRRKEPQYFRGLTIKEEHLILLIAVVSLGLKAISEKISFSHKAFHILAHQLICVSLQNNGIQAYQAWKILSGASCFKNITKEQFFDLVEFMLENKFLRDVDGEIIIGEKGEKYFLGSNWKNLFAIFDSAPMYEVYDEKKHIGTLDASFVESLEVPFLFILGGMQWEAFKVKTLSRQVFVKKTEIGKAPKWNAFCGMDVPYETAKESGKLLFSDIIPSFLNKDAREGLLSIKNKIKGINWQDGKWVLVHSIEKTELWNFSGDKINRTLAKIITESKLGEATSNYKRISVKNVVNNHKKIIPELMSLISDIKKDTPKGIYRFHNLLKRSLRIFPFSKFSKCLSDNLWKEAFIERVFDYDCLIKELQKNRIEISKYT